MSDTTKGNKVYKRGREIGKQPYRALFEMTACPDCGVERWVVFYSGKPKYSLCRKCAYVRRGNRIRGTGKGFKSKEGYQHVYIGPESPFTPMSRRQDTNMPYILEHRLVMAKHLGRCLKPHEIVHHLNGIKDDNRLENLTLVDRSDHKELHTHADYKARIRELEAKLALYERGANGLVMCA